MAITGCTNYGSNKSKKNFKYFLNKLRRFIGDNRCVVLHKWSNWTHYSQKSTDRITGKVQYVAAQKRICLKCNKMEIELIKFKNK